MPLATILPRHRVSLLAGVRDSGKTRFILPAMADWYANGGPSWAYVAGDRSSLDAADTIREMNFQPGAIPLIAAFGDSRLTCWGQVVQVLMHRDPIPEIVVVEAFQDLADSINKRDVVHNFMNMVDADLKPGARFVKGLTVIGITGAPKQTKNNRYPDPSQRIPGTAIWGERCSLLFPSL